MKNFEFYTVIIVLVLLLATGLCFVGLVDQYAQQLIKTMGF